MTSNSGGAGGLGAQAPLTRPCRRKGYSTPEYHGDQGTLPDQPVARSSGFIGQSDNLSTVVFVVYFTLN
jgi:hypothetical protein